MSTAVNLSSDDGSRAQQQLIYRTKAKPAKKGKDKKGKKKGGSGDGGGKVSGDGGKKSKKKLAAGKQVNACF